MPVKYIFSINSGRSGSDYLTEIFAHTENTISVHEGFPVMNGQPMIAFNEGDPAALSALMPLKVAQIENKRKNSQKVYCESNHTYIKGWGYLLPDKYFPQDEIGVVILRRDPEKVVRSMLRVRSVPGISEWSRTWYLVPGAQENLSDPEKGAGIYDLCEWQVKEIMLRAADYQNRFPQITYFDCNLDQLNDYGFVLQMLKIFGLKPLPTLKNVVGKPINTKEEWPKASLEDLLSIPQYPNADSLPSIKRDKLLREMVAYLQTEKATEIDQAKSNIYGIKSSQIHFARKIVAQSEKDIESAFHYRLKYTETEIALIYEFLHTIAPKDIAFFHIIRNAHPFISFTFDFNKILRISEIAQRLGVISIIKFLILSLPGIRGFDFSHKPK